MFQSMWRRWLNRQWHSARGSRTPARRRGYRPHMEELEARTVPSTFLVLNTNDSGDGSLRQAILNANATPGLNSVDFAVGSGGIQTIAPASPLPTITNPVVIDGTSQPGY